MTAGPSRDLLELAGLYGVQPSYRGLDRRRHHASAGTILGVLRALGCPLESPSGAREQARRAAEAAKSRLIEPAHVAWNGFAPALRVNLPAAIPISKVRCTLVRWDPDEGRLGRPYGVVVAARPGGAVLRLPSPLPAGYHLIELAAGKVRAESLVISAPTAAADPPRAPRRRWGCFLPLYALRSERNWGIGDFTDLREAAGWIGERGGSFVGTLPLLAACTGEAPDPSPYAPSSRLFLNELYLDVAALPEFAACAPARRAAGRASFTAELAALRRSSTVDYARQMAIKRRVLERLAAHASTSPSRRCRAFRKLAREDATLADFSRFRAVAERRGAEWTSWPEPLRGGRIGDRDFDESVRAYHAYVQWAAGEQFAAAARTARASGVGLYLDLPLGVQASGYDAYRYRDLFMFDLSAGAPPDSFFAAGQNWGFPPLHPRRLRESRYAYWILSLRRLMSFASVLRIDHVMGLHRLYCVPGGMGAGEGAYIRYSADEMYAVLVLESARSGCMVIGEDLGVVPSEVREKMARHGVRRMYVLEMEVSDAARHSIPEAPRKSLACLNTHDMPTFAGFWRGLDIDRRVAQGQLGRREASRERRNRSAVRREVVRHLRAKGLLGKAWGLAEVYRACLAELARGRAEIVMVNLEDLWQETRPQNVPGTWKEYPNWRRKSRVTFEGMRRHRPVAACLEELNVLVSSRHGRRG